MGNFFIDDTRKKLRKAANRFQKNIKKLLKKNGIVKVFIFAFCFGLLPAIAVNAATLPEPDGAEVFFFRTKEVDVPVIMYHLITEKPKYIGKYGVTPTEVEADLVYLKENGYTTVHMQDLVNFVERGDRLPKKPIVLTFDDGNSSDYTYLFPLLQKHEMKAVLAIIGEATDRCTNDSADNPKGKYPNLTWPQIKEMYESELLEIQSHGYNMHGKLGSGKKRGESADAYAARLTTDLKKLQDACQAHLGYVPNTFIYPLGIVGEGSRQVFENLGMVASLGCEEGVTVVRQGDKDCLFRMHRYNRPSGKSVQSILEKIAK